MKAVRNIVLERRLADLRASRVNDRYRNRSEGQREAGGSGQKGSSRECASDSRPPLSLHRYFRFTNSQKLRQMIHAVIIDVLCRIFLT